MSIVLVGSTSGSITLQEPAVAGTTVLDLPAVSGTILTTTSPKAGNVIQVVQTSYGTQTSNGTTTYADTGLTATITPQFATSKILVLVNQSSIAKDGATSVNTKLLRNSTDLIVFGGTMTASGSSNTTSASSATCSYLDNPATTSATTYKTQFAINNGSGVVAYVQWNGIGSSTITLMEIAG